jgi:putative membrane protein
MTHATAVATDLAVGIAAGLAASLVMSLFQKAWTKTVATPSGPSATDDAAYHLSSAVTGRPATPKGRKALSGVIHYTAGAILGGVYGLMSGVFPSVTGAKGAAFGATVWAVGDEVAVPLLGLGSPLGRTDPLEHAYGLASHVVFGVTLDFVRRRLNARIAELRQ